MVAADAFATLTRTVVFVALVRERARLGAFAFLAVGIGVAPVAVATFGAATTASRSQTVTLTCKKIAASLIIIGSFDITITIRTALFTLQPIIINLAAVTLHANHIGQTLALSRY
jgi:biotin transporter BioY